MGKVQEVHSMSVRDGASAPKRHTMNYRSASRPQTELACRISSCSLAGLGTSWFLEPDLTFRYLLLSSCWFSPDTGRLSLSSNRLSRQVYVLSFRPAPVAVQPRRSQAHELLFKTRVTCAQTVPAIQTPTW